MSHRKPPKGDDWRKDWKDHGVLSSSTRQREAVYERDQGICACCGEKVEKWEADHIIALHTIPQSKLEDYPNCLWYWSLENLQTLCKGKCHRKKSCKERTCNAKVKRIKAKHEGTYRKSKFKVRSRGFQKKPKKSKVERIKEKNASLYKKLREF